MHLEIEILTTCTFYTRISVIVLRGRPFPFYYPLERGKERGLVEACTSFRVIPLDSWGAILSLYCLFRGVAFCDVELNTRIKTAFSSLRILFWWRWTIQLLCVLLRWNMDAYLVANRKKQFRIKMSLFLYLLAMASHRAAIHCCFLPYYCD